MHDFRASLRIPGPAPTSGSVSGNHVAAHVARLRTPHSFPNEPGRGRIRDRCRTFQAAWTGTRTTRSAASCTRSHQRAGSRTRKPPGARKCVQTFPVESLPGKIHRGLVTPPTSRHGFHDSPPHADSSRPPVPEHLLPLMARFKSRWLERCFQRQRAGPGPSCVLDSELTSSPRWCEGIETPCSTAGPKGESLVEHDFDLPGWVGTG